MAKGKSEIEHPDRAFFANLQKIIQSNIGELNLTGCCATCFGSSRALITVKPAHEHGHTLNLVLVVGIHQPHDLVRRLMQGIKREESQPTNTCTYLFGTI